MESRGGDNPALDDQRTDINCDNPAPETSLEDRDLWLKEYVGAVLLDQCKPSECPDYHVVTQVEQDTLDDDLIEAMVSECTSRFSRIDKFCHECKDSFTRWPEVSTGTGALIRYINTITIEAAARKGCQLCSFVFQALVHWRSLPMLRRIEARVRNETDVNPASLWIVQDDGRLDHPDRVFVKLPGRELSKNEHWGDFDYSVVATEDVQDSPLDTLGTARNWLHECQHNHTHCVKPNTADLPTRFVSIANGGLRLVLTKDWVTTPPYATLSHCWGRVEFLKLKKNNERAFLQTIPSDQLPKTFKDALDITRELGLKYIWIDSLCIVQDDEDDWRREAARMSIVYGGSYVNIAASAATDPHQGFFPMPSHSIDGIIARVKIHGERDDEDAWVQFEQPAAHSNAVWSCHLASRAWAFQEKVLSPRTIHFGNYGMFWECASKVASESLPGGVRTPLQRGRTLQQYGETQDLSNWWSVAVDFYSTTELTYARDKLVAISGIARRLSERIGCKYLAGLWLNDTFEEQLCWRINDRDDLGRSTRPLRSRPVYRAPSWSWASIDHPVGYFFQLLPTASMFIQVLDADTEPLKGQDQFGEITGGWLRIAFTGILSAQVPHPDNSVMETDSGSFSFMFFLDTLVSETILESRCFVLPIRERETMIVGILIHRDSHDCKFRRIGWFVVSPVESDSFVRELNAQGKAVSRAECTELVESAEHPDKPFVITIV